MFILAEDAETLSSNKPVKTDAFDWKILCVVSLHKETSPNEPGLRLQLVVPV